MMVLEIAFYSVVLSAQANLNLWITLTFVHMIEYLSHYMHLAYTITGGLWPLDYWPAGCVPQLNVHWNMQRLV